MNIALTICGMAAITFTVKAVMFLLGGRVTFPPLLDRALGFVPVTVLTAIIVPMILSPHGPERGLELHWRNPQLAGALAAALVCGATRHQLATIGIGLAVFFSWQFAIA